MRRGLPAVAELKWHELCDPFYADRVCETVHLAIEGAARGARDESVHIALRTYLAAPAQQYRAVHWPGSSAAAARRNDLQAADILSEEAEKLAELLQEGYPFVVTDAGAWALRLRRAWSQFIEAACAPVVQGISRTNAKSAGLPRKPYLSASTGDRLTPALLLERLVTLLAPGGAASQVKGAQATLREEFGISPSTQGRWLAEFVCKHTGEALTAAHVQALARQPGVELSAADLLQAVQSTFVRGSSGAAASNARDC